MPALACVRDFCGEGTAHKCKGQTPGTGLGGQWGREEAPSSSDAEGDGGRVQGWSMPGIRSYP